MRSHLSTLWDEPWWGARVGFGILLPQASFIIGIGLLRWIAGLLQYHRTCHDHQNPVNFFPYGYSMMIGSARTSEWFSSNNVIKHFIPYRNKE